MVKVRCHSEHSSHLPSALFCPTPSRVAALSARSQRVPETEAVTIDPMDVNVVMAFNVRGFKLVSAWTEVSLCSLSDVSYIYLCIFTVLFSLFYACHVLPVAGAICNEFPSYIASCISPPSHIAGISEERAARAGIAQVVRDRHVLVPRQPLLHRLEAPARAGPPCLLHPGGELRLLGI